MVARNAFENLATEAKQDELLALPRAELTPNGAQVVGNARTKFRDGFASPGAQPDAGEWLLDNEAPGEHLVIQGGDAAGAAYLRISMSPFLDNSTVRLSSVQKFRAPTRLGWGVSQNQRVLGQELFYGLAEADDADSILLKRTSAQLPDQAISQIVVTSNVGTVTCPRHPFKTGDRVIVIGCQDTRLNVGPVIVTVTGANTFTLAVTIANSTYSGASVTGGAVRHADPLSRADNAGGFLLENATTTQGSFTARRNRAKYRLATHTIGSTANSQTLVGSWLDSFGSAAVHEMLLTLDEFSFRSWTSDGLSAMTGHNKYTQGIPDEEVDYRLHVRARNLEGMTRPIARIVSAVKSASTTATITTDRPHGLTTLSRVGIYGIRDVTNFAAQADASVASVPSATTFTVAFGASTTATDVLGGIVVLNQGGVTGTGMLPGAISSISRDADGIVTLVGTSTWSGFTIGELVHLWGMNGGAAAAHEGAYKILANSGTSLFLEPAVGGRVLDQVVTTIGTGGQAIRRTEHRLHYVRVMDHTRLAVEVHGGRGSLNDANNAVPVVIATSPTLGVSATNAPPLVGAVNESVANLAANGLYTGATRDIGSDLTRISSRIRVSVRHLAGLTPGVLYLEQSTDATTWFETWRQTIPSDGMVHIFEAPLTVRYHRWRFQNGATAQTGFWFQTFRVLMEGPVPNPRRLDFPLSTTALGSGANFTSTTLDLGNTHDWEQLWALAFADQAGTLHIDVSRDNATWRTMPDATLAVGAGETRLLKQDIVPYRYARVRYVNGASAQGAFALDASLILR